MGSKERFLKAILLEKPDAVPISDLSMSIAVACKLLNMPLYENYYYISGIPRESWQRAQEVLSVIVRAHKKVDFDAVFIHQTSLIAKKYKPIYISQNRYIDEWGIVRENRPETKMAWWVDGVIKNEEQLIDYNPPDPEDEGRLELLDKVIREASSEMAVVGVLNGVFTLAWEVMGGIDKFVLKAYKQPTYVEKLCSKISKCQLEWTKMMIDAGVDMIAYCEDIADLKGLLINPKLCEKYVISYLKEILRHVHRRGLKLMFHSDGNLYNVLEELIRVGIDGLNPIEPEAMNLRYVKEKYGERIFLMGNVDCKFVLVYGDESDVRKEVRRCIDEASEGGGFVLASSNSLHPAVKPENVYIMVDEARKYGVYSY